MPAENVTHIEIEHELEHESLDDMTLDVRAMRDTIARTMIGDLSELEIRRVAELADVILGMTIAERAALGAILREAQPQRPAVDIG